MARLKIDHKIIITGIIALASIYITLIICDHDTTQVGYIIIAVIALAIGIIIPAPRRIDKRGMLIW